jgi:hypothetical protein
MSIQEAINEAITRGKAMRVTGRTGLRLRRLALEMEELANQLEQAGWSKEQGDVRRAAGLLGNAGHNICDCFGEQKSAFQRKR